MADRLLQAAPLAARATKEVAVRSRQLSSLEAIRFGETMRKVAATTTDAAEGLEAARRGRAPRWTGR
jgi:enoyl-CoA hydratase/carnithine racemase